MAVDLKRFVRDIPDFPQSGIVVKDATPLLLHGEALDQAVSGLCRLRLPDRAELPGWTGPPGAAPGFCAARLRRLVPRVRNWTPFEPPLAAPGFVLVGSRSAAARRDHRPSAGGARPRQSSASGVS